MEAKNEVGRMVSSVCQVRDLGSYYRCGCKKSRDVKQRREEIKSAFLKGQSGQSTESSWRTQKHGEPSWEVITATLQGNCGSLSRMETQKTDSWYIWRRIGLLVVILDGERGMENDFLSVLLEEMSNSGSP